MTGLSTKPMEIAAPRMALMPCILDEDPGQLEGLAAVIGEMEALEEQLLKDLEFHGIVGKSSVMLEVFDFARKVARHYTNVLLLGPTGTGKELVARAIH